MNRLSRSLLRLTAALCLWGAPALQARVNFILIYMDDLGYGDVGVYGAQGFETPNLDRMAAEGVRFTDFYSANTVCSPSRAALLSGKYPTRVQVPEVIGPGSEKYLGEVLARGLPRETLTLAELLKTRGYATALVGKWHLGHQPGFLPTDQGFDSFFGIPYSNDMAIDPAARLSQTLRLRHGATIEKIRAGFYARDKTNPSGKPYVSPERYFTPLMENELVVEFPADQRSLTRRYTDRAIRFIEENRDRPFFLYLAHTMPHVPLAPSSAYIGRSQGGAYGDVMEEVDAEIGRLLDALKAMDLEGETLVVFTSDNGPWDLPKGFGGSAGPLKGFKFQTHEGGQRVPMIVWGPGRIPAGREIGVLTSMLDLFPTFASMAEAPLPEGLALDGHDLRPLLSGEETESPYEAFYYIRGWQVQAVRRGPWKLQLALGGHAYRQAIEEGSEGALYHLEEDPGETRDVREAHPEVARDLRHLIGEFQREVDQQRAQVPELKGNDE